MSTIDKITTIKNKLAVYAEDNNLSVEAVHLIETLIENNVSHDAADKFCEEHFMSPVIAEYYKDFFQCLLEQTKGSASKTDEVYDIHAIIADIKSKLDLLAELAG